MLILQPTNEFIVFRKQHFTEICCFCIRSTKSVGRGVVMSENQRIRLTKTLLKNALIRLLKEQNIYSISIRELCESAEINRSTFYKYYGSQFDLLTEMENDLIGIVTDSISKYPSEPELSFYDTCKCIEDNNELFRILFNNNVDPMFPEKIFALPCIQDTISQYIGESSSEAEREYKFHFLAYGMYQVIKVWINKDKRESPQEIVDLILRKMLA